VSIFEFVTVHIFLLA